MTTEVRAAAEAAGLIDRASSFATDGAGELAPPPAPAKARIARQGALFSMRFDLIAHLARQKAFSVKTFGPGPRTKGVVDHIRKELAEIEADPADVSEWIDVCILAFDGALRAGWSPEAIAEALLAKQIANEARVWPDWRTADPDKAIEHDRSFDVVS